MKLYIECHWCFQTFEIKLSMDNTPQLYYLENLSAQKQFSLQIYKYLACTQLRYEKLRASQIISFNFILIPFTITIYSVSWFSSYDTPNSLLRNGVFFLYLQVFRFSESLIYNMKEVAVFWHKQLCRCYSLRNTILIAFVNNGPELAGIVPRVLS